MRIRVMAIAAVVALAVAAGSFAAVRATTAPPTRAGVSAANLGATTAPPTHMSVPAANLVVLRGLLQNGKFQFFRIGADGSVQDDYAVPSGMALVITDVTWWKNKALPAVSLQILGLKSTAGANAIFSDPVAVPANSFPVSFHQLTTGFVVASGQKLQLSSAPGGTDGLAVLLHGYLVG